MNLRFLIAVHPPVTSGACRREAGLKAPFAVIGGPFDGIAPGLAREFPARRPYRRARLGAAILAALALTAALCYCLGRLLVVPPVKSESPIPLILRGAVAPMSLAAPNPALAKRLPLLPWRPRKIRESGLEPQPPVMIGKVSPRPAAAAARKVDWTQALRDYLEHGTRVKPSPFAMPKLPAPARSIFSLPERMRLTGGGEIDRIGEHCYAAASDITANPEAGAAPQYARWKQRALAPLLVHEVSCDPARGKSMAEDFLGHLAAHGLAPPEP